ncbi:DUF6058 family natural product biosynthesis protein [Actinophytocola oryzae]|uniref:Uncharacterized protein n=1 Tax=Actinophytocola oryzae TaxID=502181 RepID=A0A4R7URG1_9PSEU|nr:DUF6058 family natural product biosynthesis protein [Actinophytocola oryzae]TDV36050.1 hypothetical protein CLV71_13228 [Actinophytocola oryzae]
MASFTTSDLDYITTEYRTLAELCDGRALGAAQVSALVAEGRLPGATYVLPSGERRFPPDYFALVDAVGLESLAEGFRERFLAAGGAEADVDDYWQDYLGGGFGVCLRSVTPESMVAKSRLVARVAELTGASAPEDPVWRDALRTAVDELDALLRPFTDYDRERYGDTSRDKNVTRVRATWAEVFEECDVHPVGV